MAKLPVISGKKAIKAFEKAGFVKCRQRGSHVNMKKEGEPVLLPVPLHRELKRSLLRDLIRDAGLTTEQFVDLL